MTGLALYSATASASSQSVIRAYSTSFGMASRLLPSRVRTAIGAIYALVRLADEVVDGPAAEAGLDAHQRRAALDSFEAETAAAVRNGFSTNLVVQAFATTARETGIGDDLLAPFFASMRADLTPPERMDDGEYRRYIHGSAEVVGSMCLRAFRLEAGAAGLDVARLDPGAQRLGAAFQKVNFLRDLADDRERLGRVYIPGSDHDAFCDTVKNAVVAEIDDDLAAARAAIAALPPRSRRATRVAAELFGELNRRLGRTPAAEIARRRVSVPTPVKLRIVATALLGARR